MQNSLEHHRDNIRVVYCSLDRIVCNGVIQSLQTGAAVVAFFRQQRGVQRVDRQLFASLARQLRHHIEGFARRHLCLGERRTPLGLRGAFACGLERFLPRWHEIGGSFTR